MMLVGMFLFSMNDAIGKWLVATYSVGKVRLIRSQFALAVLVVLFRASGFGSVLQV